MALLIEVSCGRGPEGWPLNLEAAGRDLAVRQGRHEGAEHGKNGGKYDGDGHFRLQVRTRSGYSAGGDGPF